MKKLNFHIVLLMIAVSAFAVSAQTALTAADYERAEKALGYNTSALIDRSGVRPTFLPDGRFWYRILTATGLEFVLVDPAKGTRVANTDPKALGIDAPTGPIVGFRAGGGDRVTSPDGKRAVFIRDWNLWVVDLESKKETQLTKDGIENFGYATDNAGWRKSNRPIVLWSPDSRRVATYQQDQRNVSDMYLVTTNVGEPRLEAWKYPIPADKEVIKIHRVIIDVVSGETVRLKVAADDRRGTLCDDIACGGSFDDNNWSEDSTKLAFVSTPRDHKWAKLRLADAATGDVREILQETVATQYESGQGEVNWRYFSKTNEYIWYSEKSDWGHLYLHDGNGGLKNQITSGNWVVTRIVSIDEANRVIYFEANGREAGRDPYFSHFYRVNFDGKGLKLLTPEAANHQITLTPDGKYFVDNYSRPEVPPVATLRDLDGKLIATLETADISRLTATSWRPPMPVTVKSRDGRWDLYGLMFRPSNFDPKKKYPVVNYIYPGPQGGGFGSRSFSPARGDNQALAELGFIVVVIDGTCNPDRSKSFHDVCYGNMADNTLEDQIAGMKELAVKHPYMDLNRVGIWGHSGGGFATAAAMFRYPDFFKVGISESGNHDNRNYEDDWGERYIGLLVGDNYEKQANQNFAKNLKGKLLLAHGGMDDNVPPYNTYLVVDALVKANKDFDLIVFPNARHGYGADTYYMMRRRWDYFVKHLAGMEPPAEYKLTPKQDPRIPTTPR